MYDCSLGRNACKNTSAFRHFIGLNEYNGLFNELEPVRKRTHCTPVCYFASTCLDQIAL